jgi:hypothetical protein
MSGPDKSEGEGSFLGGWSKRKLAAERQDAPDTKIELSLGTQAEPDPFDPLAVDEDIDEQVVAELPSLEDIIEGSDIKPFLAKGVPAKLKNAAMRRLWLATPNVRDYADPAVDYAWDWNAPGGVPGGGGKLTEAGIAKMVKGLIGGQNDHPSEESDEADLLDAEGVDLIASVSVEEDAVPKQDDVPPSPVRLSDANTPLVSLSPPNAGSQEAIREAALPADTFPPPPRRHGGAAPE